MSDIGGWSKRIRLFDESSKCACALQVDFKQQMGRSKNSSGIRYAAIFINLIGFIQLLILRGSIQ